MRWQSTEQAEFHCAGKFIRDNYQTEREEDMGECLVVGEKNPEGSQRATFVILNERPGDPLLGANAAKQISDLIGSRELRRLEDGPVGGTPLKFGDEVIGQAVDAPLPDSGGWNLARVADVSLAQAAYQLASKKRLWLPGMKKSGAKRIPMATVEEMGEIGPYHMDINAETSTGGIRGPFKIVPVKPHSVPTYPVFWAHDTEREQTMLFEADCEGLSLKGRTDAEQEIIDKKVDNVAATASHCHFNRDFRFNSQATGMQFTNRRTIGGRAWLSIQLSSAALEKALVLWANTSLGLLMYWWHANKQQPGRGSIGKTALQTLPVLDVAALKPKQLKEAVRLFDSMSTKKFLAAHEIDRDIVRKELDESFVRDVLGLPVSIVGPGGPLEVLRMKLAREPSIRGQKE